MVDSSLSYISIGDKVVFTEKAHASMLNYYENAPMEVLGMVTKKEISHLCLYLKKEQAEKKLLEHFFTQSPIKS